MISTAKQAVRTFMTGPQDGASVAEPDIYELGSNPQAQETPVTEDGQDSDQQGQREDLEAKVDRLSANFDQRLGAKDQFIAQLQGENQTLRAVAANAAPGRETETPTPDPVLDKDTAELFAKKYEKNPAEAMVALANHLDRRNVNRTVTVEAHRDQKAKYTGQIAAAERNVLIQVNRAVKDYGDEAIRIVGDFKNLTDAGGGSSADYANTWLGRNIIQDNSLAVSSQSVYRLIENEVLRARAEPTPQPTAEPTPIQGVPTQTPVAAHGVGRPAAPSRSVAPVEPAGGEISVEDAIGNAILDSARGEDAEARRFLTGV